MPKKRHGKVYTHGTTHDRVFYTAKSRQNTCQSLNEVNFAGLITDKL
jgi:hypothetical protein